MERFVRQFKGQREAITYMKRKNNVNQIRGRRWVVVDGPDNNFAVVDINTAIGLGGGYIF